MTLWCLCAVVSVYGTGLASTNSITYQSIPRNHSRTPCRSILSIILSRPACRAIFFSPRLATYLALIPSAYPVDDAGTNCILTASAIEFCNIMCYDLLDKHTTVIIDKTTGEPVSAKQIEITKVRRMPASDPILVIRTHTDTAITRILTSKFISVFIP